MILILPFNTLSIIVVSDLKIKPFIVIRDPDYCDTFYIFILKDFLGGNSKKIVIVGQSAGAHLGSTIIINKVLESFHSLDYQHETSWRPTDIKGFMAVSGPYNMVRMKEVFHKHGLPRNIVS